MVAVSAQGIRQVLREEGAFKGAANAETAPRETFRAVEDISGLIMCHICSRSRPCIDELVFVPELEEGALRAGWRYDEEDRWMCPECLGGL
jgi:hypothetical protein